MFHSIPSSGTAALVQTDMTELMAIFRHLCEKTPKIKKCFANVFCPFFSYKLSVQESSTIFTFLVSSRCHHPTQTARISDAFRQNNKAESGADFEVER
jgi:hypothetical protein